MGLLADQEAPPNLEPSAWRKWGIGVYLAVI
jgi:hypothetical protein